MIKFVAKKYAAFKQILSKKINACVQKLYYFMSLTIFKLNIMNTSKTIDYIIDNKCSISRFGDGEFDMMFSNGDIGFQKYNVDLAKKLTYVFAKPPKCVLLCIPYQFCSLKEIEPLTKKWWREWGKDNLWHIVPQIRKLKKNYLFGDAMCTRCYMAYKSHDMGLQNFTMWKKVWSGRDILIIEGEYSCLGVGNDLFDGCNSIKRIIAPAENAFQFYQRIIDTVVSIFDGELILISLGPTATILACELSQLINAQCLDVGHIDVEYEWFLADAKKRCAIPGKYTNEVSGGNNVESCTDEIYQRQIIYRIE